MKNTYLLVVFAFFISACASTEKQETLGDLGELDIKIEHVPIEKFYIGSKPKIVTVIPNAFNLSLRGG